MENSPIKLKFLTLLLLIVPFISLAQTQQWRLIWDQNKEDDISHYRIFRGNSINPTTSFATVNYPDTIFTDTDLTPGTHYYYRISAVDTEELESDYSDNVDAAIPKISTIGNRVFNHGGSITLDLDDFVSDPDAIADQITWTFTNSSHLNFELGPNRQLTITSPDSSWLEEVVFTATDEDDFYDQQRVWITVNAIPVIAGTLPATYLQQQGSPFFPIPLDDYTDDLDQADSMLVWEIRDTGDLNAELDAQHQLVVSHPDNFTDKPVEDQWYGVENILIKVSDAFGASDSIRIKFDVNAKPKITSSPVTQHQALQEYRYPLLIQDEDSVQVLTVEWFEYPDSSKFESLRLLTWTPSISDTGLHPIRVRVSDSRGGHDVQEFTLDVQFTPGTPLLSSMASASQSIEEGQEFAIIHLNDYVLNMEEQESISWSASGQTELSVTIDSYSNATILMPNKDWFGQEHITFRATNEQGLFAEQTVVFTVEAVNDAPLITGVSGQKIHQNDQFDILDLSSRVSDVDDDQADLVWTVSGNHNLDITVMGAHRFQIMPKQADWFGKESLEFIVSDQQGATDQITVLYEIGKSIYGPFSTRFINSGTILQVTWDTELETIGTIHFGKNDFERSTAPEPRQVTSHTIILSGLDAHTDYQLYALSEDSSGYKHISDIHTFTTGMAGEISVFPNPYRAGAYPENDVIHFANLPEGTTVSIFNLLGEPIFNKQDQSDLFRWDGKNNQQKEVQSGLYIYLLKDADNKKIESGKIVIIR